MSKPIVSLVNVEKWYGTNHVVKNMNINIAEGEFLTLLGPSGCGKSTLLNIIAGLLEPTSGAVYCNGKEVKGTGTDRGVVFQQYALFPWLTVKKNVMFALKDKEFRLAELGNDAGMYGAVRMVLVD